jgi:hypothetical protein
VSRSSRVPPQLQTAPRRRVQRPLFEDLHYLDIRRLGREGMFPGDWYGQNIYENVGFIFPGVKRLTLTRGNVTAIFYGGKEQVLPVKWFKPGLSQYSNRPVSKCSCGKGCFRFYIKDGRLACYRCTTAVYASQTRNSDTRAYIQLRRIRAYLSSATGLHSRTKHRLKATELAIQARLPARYVWHSKRIPDKALRPRQRYRHHGSMDVT